MSTLIARIIESTRKNWATERWRQVAGGRAHRPCEPGPAPLVLSDVSTLYFETNPVGGFRQPGFSEQRRPHPQTTLGLLTDASLDRRVDVGDKRVRVRPPSRRRHGGG
jgi:hypothetical protein